MEKLKFETSINASKEKVWESLWQPYHYNTWTSAFAEGSTAKTDNWKEGSRVLFLDGNGQGMVSKVAANRPYEYMSFQHLGFVKDGVEDTSSEAVKAWAGSTENYTLSGNNGSSRLMVEMDITPEFKEYFEKTWPLAMEKIKGLAEGTVRPVITVKTEVNAPVSKVWNRWTTPEHIMQWNNATDDWHTPSSMNDLRVGGSFSSTMAAKDGSFSFDFGGVYTAVKENERIEYTLGDGRKVKVIFKDNGHSTMVTERFEAEGQHSLELQHGGWQAILDNFKKYTENH